MEKEVKRLDTTKVAYNKGVEDVLNELKVRVDRQYKNCHGYRGNKKDVYREALLAVKSMIHEIETKNF